MFREVCNAQRHANLLAIVLHVLCVMVSILHGSNKIMFKTPVSVEYLHSKKDKAVHKTPKSCLASKHWTPAEMVLENLYLMLLLHLMAWARWMTSPLLEESQYCLQCHLVL